LSQAWFALHGLPFVFARWVVRKDAPDRIKGQIADWLDRFKANEDHLVQQAISGSAERLQLSEDVIRRYFQVIRRSLDEEDLQGQQLFVRQLERSGREPLFQPSITTD
jgi:predicted solute-binding protein